MSSTAPGSERRRKLRMEKGVREEKEPGARKKNNRWRKGIKEEEGQREQEEEIKASSRAINRSFSRK